jgi:outer membrane protein, heavy metal efflux system
MTRLLVPGLTVQLTLASAFARAETGWPVPVHDPVLASLIEEAQARNPDVAGARLAAAAAAQLPAAARSLPNPMFSVGYTNDGWSPSLGEMEDSNLAFMASQELPYFGKRGLRGRIAERTAGLQQQQAERVTRGIVAAVKRAYFGLVLSRTLLDLISDQEQVWKQIEGVTRARYAVGQGAQQDVLRVQVEVTRIEQFRAEQEAEQDVRRAELNKLLGREGSAPLETPARLTLRPVRASLDELLAWARDVSPEIKGAEIEVDRASLSVALAKKEWKPDFSVQTAYMNRGGFDPMWQAGIGISLPLYRKRLSAGVAEAQTKLESSRKATDSIELELRFRTQERLTRLKTTERIAILYGEGIVPQDRMSVESALANYQAGKVPFITVLDALTTLYNDRSTHLRLLATHEQIVASLEEASLEPTPGMAASGPAGMAPTRGSGLGAGASSGDSSSMGSSGMGR